MSASMGRRRVRVAREGASLALCVVLALHVACGGERSSSDEASAPGQSVAGRRALRPDGFPGDRPYSYGVRVDDAVHLAGQLGRHPATGETPEGIEAQTRRAMDNIGAILAADGLGHEHLVKCHVFLASMDDYAGMNAAYGSYFEGRVPARTTVEASAVPGGSRVEIGCIAYADLAGISVVRPTDGSLPAPLGPYSPAVWAGDRLYVSGMGGQNPADRQVADAVPAQVTQTLANIGTTLTAAGLGFQHVASTSVLLTTPAELEGFDAALAAPFPEGQGPAVAPVFVPRLPGPIKAEITVVAARSRDGYVATPAVAAADAGADITPQARVVFGRLRERVEAEGLSWADVVDVRVYLADLADMPEMDAIFRELFPTDPPARTTVQANLQDGARIQAAVTAMR